MCTNEIMIKAIKADLVEFDKCELSLMFDEDRIVPAFVISGNFICTVEELNKKMEAIKEADENAR